MSKEHVIAAQTALNNAGFNTNGIDGIFGKDSLKALQQLINKNGNLDEAEAPKIAHYILSEKSLRNLNSVHPNLQKVVKLAIQITDMDFAVNEGSRTKERQRKLVNQGSSQTMQSNHLTGNAVDLVPTPNGGAKDWDNWDNYYVMAEAMKKAAEELEIKIKWGACWEVINGKTGTPKSWVEAYGERRRKIGKKPFTDGPHFELA